MFRKGGVLKRIIYIRLFEDKCSKQEGTPTRAERMINNPVIVGKVYLPNKNFSL